MKVSIGIRRPDFKAGESLLNDPTSHAIGGIGDEAVVWGYFGNITFRHGQIGVSVSSEADLNLLSREKDDNRAMSRVESAATTRLISCFINLALDGQLTKGGSHSREPIFQRPCEQELVFKRLIGEELLRQLINRY